MEIVQEPVVVKSFKRSSIHNYFKPLPTPPALPKPTSPEERAKPATLAARSSSLEQVHNCVAHGQSGQRKRPRRLNARPQLALNESTLESSDRDPCREDGNRVEAGDALASEQGLGNLFDNHEVVSATVTSTRRRKTQQALLDLSTSAFVECKVCKMQYNKTDKGDRNAHDRFHVEFVNGKQSKANNSAVVVYAESFSGEVCGRKKSSLAGHHEICIIDRSSPVELRTQSQAALELSYKDMDGVSFLPEELWSEIPNPHNVEDKNSVGRFKIFTYHINREIAAVLLAERVAVGVEQVNGKFSPRRRRVYLGVERVWVKKNFRRQGLGTRLLDIARDTFICGLVLSKKQIAFSAPTNEGAKFAQAYCRGSFPEATFLIYL